MNPFTRGHRHRLGSPPSQQRQGLLLQRLYRQVRNAQAGSLPYALIIALVVLITGLAVASRTLNGIYSAVFQQDSRRSREAAELGINRIVAELNRERNRGLLARNPAPASGGFWTQTEADASKNACAVRANDVNRPTGIDLNLIRSGGVAGTTTTNPIIYVADNGTLTADTDNVIDDNRPATQRYAYQLVTNPTEDTIQVNPIAGPDPNPASPTFGQLNQVGAINLRVRGYSYNNGRLSGSVVVEQQLEVLPKCCGRSLAQFGNDLRSCTVGTGPGFGFLIGVGENSVGDADLNGSKSELDNGTTPINPVVCLGTKGTSCPADVSVGTTTVTVVSVLKPPTFPDVEIWPSAALGAAPTAGTLEPCQNASKCPSNLVPNGASSATTFTTVNSGVTKLNVTTVTDANLPTWCKSRADDPTSGVTTIHCNVSELSLSDNIDVLTSTTRRLKLYFSTEGSKITSTGTNQFRHVNTTTGATDAQDVLQLQLFGCREATSPSKGCVGDASKADIQTMSLNGNSGTAADPYFLYFPIGNLTLNGGGGTADQFNGVLWLNQVQGNGSVEINVPGSGVQSILSQYGVIDGAGTGNDKPLLWDYVTRAVRSFQLLPGA